MRDAGGEPLITGERNLAALLRTLEPELHDGVFAFVSVPEVDEGLAPIPIAPVPMAQVLATMREPEGTTLVVPVETAVATGLKVAFEARWITLRVHSSLDAVGLTATFSAALAQQNISCNVIAGTFHDHLFVPVADAERAMVCLRQLQKSTIGGTDGGV